MTVLNDSLMFLTKGGLLMVPIIICSIFAIAVVIERALFFKQLRKTRKLVSIDNIFSLIKKNKFDEALKICGQYPYCVTNILKSGILKFKKSKDSIQQAMEMSSLYELPLLEKKLPVLSTLAHISPLLGLLGTVIGLVKSFYSIELKASSAGVINPSDIAGGIWEALLTTVAGLTVAIICYVAYNYFFHKVNYYLLQSERAANKLLEIANDK